MTADNPQGGRYLSLLLDQLADERAKKGSLEQRGIAIISTAGVLVAITLGSVALATRDQSYTVPGSAVLLLLLALVGLVTAAAMGLIINVPARIPMVDDSDLANLAEQPRWDQMDAESLREDHRIRAAMLIGLRRVNRLRARLLFVGLLLEVVALGLLAVSVLVILWSLL